MRFKPLDLTGAKVLANPLYLASPKKKKAPRKGKKAPKPEAPSKLYKPGEVIAAFTVTGRAVPWKVARMQPNGGSIVDPKMTAWKQEIRVAASLHMAGRLPHSGYFQLKAFFALTPKPQMPDLCNLTKNFEDALQGIVYVNDRKTQAMDLAYDDNSATDFVHINIIAL